MVCLLGCGLIPTSFPQLGVARAIAGEPEAPRWGVYEIVLTAAEVPDHPFLEVDFTVDVTAPDGRRLVVDGFFDGNGQGGQNGSVWKARLSPDQVGTWSWRSHSDDPRLDGNAGTFTCVAGDSRGPVTAVGRHFRFAGGDYVYLVGNFLDRATVAREQFSHTLFSEQISEQNRQNMISRHRDLHRTNKMNVYLANRGDYGGIATTPWVGSSNANDKTRFDLSRWHIYERLVAQLADEGMIAEIWFFADDSGFGNLPDADRQRLIHYGLARLGAYANTMFILCLEWQEGWSMSEVRSHADFLQEHNPWSRLASVHGTTGNFSFPHDPWADFMATQSGNSIDPAGNNAHTVFNRALVEKPLIVEEFGILERGAEKRLRGNLWAAFCGGAAGSGTGSDLGRLRLFVEERAIPFWRMAPANGLASAGFVLAQESEEHAEYVVYSLDGAPFDLEIAAGIYRFSWFSPRTDDGISGPAVEVQGGLRRFTPPTEDDWVLHVYDPSTRATYFVRGECNDDGVVDLSDAACSLDWLFTGRTTPGCLAALNADGDEDVDLSDALWLLGFLFLGGPPPPPPFPDCGPGTLAADSDLGCMTAPRDCQP